MSSRTASIITSIFLFTAAAGIAAAQQPEASATPTPVPTPVATPSRNADGSPNYTAEQIAESVVILNGGGGGRALLDQIRKTTFERGRITVTNTAGKTETVPYQRWIIRGENSYKDRLRFEQDFPDARYSMVQNSGNVFGIYNDSSFTPREDAVRSFQNQVFRGLDGLLRYKENGSTVSLGERTRVMGVDYFVVDVTDKEQRKTRYYISVKSLKVMMLEYEDGGVNYRRRFYDYRVAQGTLVPFRSVLWADDKIVEETNIGTITFGQKVDDGLFPQA